MRKYLLVFVLFVSLLPSGAHAQNSLTRLYHKITRYAAAQKPLPWVIAVKQQQSIALPYSIWKIQDDSFPVQQQPLPPAELSLLFNLRTKHWQQLLDRHPLLHNYTFKVMHVQDVVKITSRQLSFLEHFLQNETTLGKADPRYLPANIEKFQHYLLRLTLQPNAQEPVYLIANCYTNELFLTLCADDPAFPLKPYAPAYMSSFH